MKRYCDAISLIDKPKLVDIDHSDPHSSPLDAVGNAAAIHIDHQLFNNLSFCGFFSFNVLSLMVDFFRFRSTTFQQTPCHTLCGPKFKFLHPYYRFKHFCHVFSSCVLHALHFSRRKGVYSLYPTLKHELPYAQVLQSIWQITTIWNINPARFNCNIGLIQSKSKRYQKSADYIGCDGELRCATILYSLTVWGFSTAVGTRVLPMRIPVTLLFSFYEAFLKYLMTTKHISPDVTPWLQVYECYVIYKKATSLINPILKTMNTVGSTWWGSHGQS